MANNGAWSVFKRLLSGQPAFENSASSAHEAGAEHGGIVPGAGGSIYLQQSGRKIYPLVRVANCEFHRSGDHAELRVHIHNDSAFEVELDSMYALGVKTELDTRLQPHGSREFLVYRGHVFTNQPQGKAELRFKIVGNGDYFMHPHDYVTRRESDGVYLVTELRANPSLITDV